MSAHLIKHENPQIVINNFKFIKAYEGTHSVHSVHL